MFYAATSHQEAMKMFRETCRIIKMCQATSIVHHFYQLYASFQDLWPLIGGRGEASGLAVCGGEEGGGPFSAPGRSPAR